MQAAMKAGKEKKKKDQKNKTNPQVKTK